MTDYFTHIPKSGGSSLRSALVEAYGDELCLCYFNPIRHRFKRRVKFQSRRLRMKVFGPKCDYRAYRIVYGHFCFDDIVPRRGDHDRLLAMFRNPIDWIGSYLHYTWERRPQTIPRDPIRAIDRLGLSAGFRRYLGRYSVKDLDFVGITEEFGSSMQLLNEVLGVSVVPDRENLTLNRPPSYAEYFRERGILKDVQERMEDNQRIYDQAVERFESLRSSA